MSAYNPSRYRVNSQPAPIATDSMAIADPAAQDIEKRKQMGIQKYGVPLQHDNGRDHLLDAYEEAIDLALYLRAEIEKRCNPNS